VLVFDVRGAKRKLGRQKEATTTIRTQAV
jgi:hypothetical protein